MGEISERPKVRSVEVEVPDGDGISIREGANLDDVLRAIVWDLKNTVYKWPSTKSAANHLGVPQQTLSDFLDESEPGTGLKTLSRVCAALQMSPVEVLQLHEKYHPESRGDSPFASDVIYNRFRSLIDLDQARKLVRIIELARERNLLDQALEFAEALAGDRVSAGDAAKLIELSRRKG